MCAVVTLASLLVLILTWCTVCETNEEEREFFFALDAMTKELSTKPHCRFPFFEKCRIPKEIGDILYRLQIFHMLPPYWYPALKSLSELTMKIQLKNDQLKQSLEGFARNC